MEIIFIVGAIQSFFQVIILLNKRGKSLPDFILSTWMFFIGFHLTLHYLGTLGYAESWPYLQGIESPMPLIHGPLMLLYVQAQNGKTWNGQWTYLLHFAPFVGLYLFYTPQFLYSIEELNAWIDGIDAGQHTPIVLIVNVLFILLSGPVYVVWSALHLRKHRKLIGQFFSYQEKINLQWLRVLVTGLGIIWVAVLGGNLVEGLLDNAPEFITEGHVIFTAVTIFAFTIGFFRC